MGRRPIVEKAMVSLISRAWSRAAYRAREITGGVRKARDSPISAIAALQHSGCSTWNKAPSCARRWFHVKRSRKIAPLPMEFPEHFDVIVVGGGHAGTEAALASARMGCNTLLLTHSIDTLGQMSCNPSIGGIGKGHLVKEVDALGGTMALATDEAGIQFRTLNSSKGAAVRATRAQADRVLYRQAIRRRLERQDNLTLFQQAVDDVLVEGGRAVGVVTQLGIRFRGRAVVLTTGTFLGGLVHVGLQNHQAGRAGDPASVTLAARL